VTAARPFVILFQGRAGSTYLTEALGSHPEVHAWFEELSVEETAAGQLESARAMLAAPPDASCRAFGFKAKLVDLFDPDAFAEVLREAHARVIALHRRNLVKWTVSWFTSDRLNETTGDWNLYREHDRLPPLEIDLDLFRERLAYVEAAAQRLRDFVAELELPTLTLHYEDLLADAAEFLRLAQAFLGVEPRPLAGRSIKNTPEDLAEVVLNVAELRAQYAGTRYEAMFDDVGAHAASF
jgi:LPS sulfotransferase NodH